VILPTGPPQPTDLEARAARRTELGETAVDGGFKAQRRIPLDASIWAPGRRCGEVVEQVAGLGVDLFGQGSTSGRTGERVSLVARRYVSVGKVKMQVTDGESMQLIYGDEVDTAGSAPDDRIKVRYRGRVGTVPKAAVDTEPRLECYFLDVGQGDATLIVTQPVRRSSSMAAKALPVAGSARPNRH